MGLGLPARPHLGCVASCKWLSPRAGGATGRTAPSGELGPLLRLFRGRRSCLWGPELRGTGPGGQPEPRGSGDLGSRLPDWSPESGCGPGMRGASLPAALHVNPRTGHRKCAGSRGLDTTASPPQEDSAAGSTGPADSSGLDPEDTKCPGPGRTPLGPRATSLGQGSAELGGRALAVLTLAPAPRPSPYSPSRPPTPRGLTHPPCPCKRALEHTPEWERILCLCGVLFRKYRNQVDKMICIRVLGHL